MAKYYIRNTLTNAKIGDTFDVVEDATEIANWLNEGEAYRSLPAKYEVFELEV